MASRPVALPEVFTGEGSQSWSDWVDHFESVAEVNSWDAAAKKKWIRARLTGRAATAMRRLSEADRESFDKIKAALKKRFEPECRKEVYMAEFQVRRKKRTEDWASFAEDLKTLVEKAYPTLQAEAQELLVLNHFLGQLEDPQLAFGVRQRTPATVDAAVAATLELETYLRPKVPTVALVTCGDRETDGPDDVIAGVAQQRTSVREDPLQRVLDRLDKLESQLRSQRDAVYYQERTGPSNGPRMTRQRKRQPRVVCWTCKEEGHLSRNCPRKEPKNQGNEKPLGQ